MESGRGEMGMQNEVAVKVKCNYCFIYSGVYFALAAVLSIICAFAFRDTKYIVGAVGILCAAYLVAASAAALVSGIRLARLPRVLIREEEGEFIFALRTGEVRAAAVSVKDAAERRTRNRYGILRCGALMVALKDGRVIAVEGVAGAEEAKARLLLYRDRAKEARQSALAGRGGKESKK